MAITTVHLLLRKWDWRNARPHPSPLPQERGKHAQFPEFSRPLLWNCFMGTHVGGYGAYKKIQTTFRPPS